MNGDQRRIYVPPPPSGQPPPPPRTRPAPPPAPQRPDGQPPRRRPGGRAQPGDRPPRGPVKPRRKGFNWRKALLISGIVLLVLLLLGFLWVNMMWNRIERVDVSPVLTSSTSGTNYLIVGADSADEDAPGFDPARPDGQRADTMMIVHFGSDGTKILSVPRDLWVTHAESGQTGRINGTFNPDPPINGGPRRLIQTITAELGIPIDRYMEVDFGSFAGLVDGMGGITIDFEHPASDPKSGLWVEQSGPVKLDGEQALAYVRSRTYTEYIDGQAVVDPTGDLGRVERQQKFLSAVMGKVSSSRNPLALGRSFGNVTGGLRIDDKMSLMDAFRLAWRMRGLSLDEDSLLILPTTPQQIGGAAVLVLNEAEAPLIVDQFR